MLEDPSNVETVREKVTGKCPVVVVMGVLSSVWMTRDR